ncbi:MAG: glycosyltransferase family 39 protein [Candidatus Methanoperedens sp.]|nr:glycosyltransferase family 39 protein [Candidatus Methanoperedens sp.]
MFFSDEGVIVTQFYNLVHGNLDLQVAKVQVERGIYITVNDHLYGKFSYSLLILSLPVYFLLGLIDSLYGAHLFLLQLWAISGGIIVYLSAKIWKNKNAAIAGLASYIILLVINLRYFEPIYFPKWGEIISIEFTNIFISSFLVLTVYFLFRDMFSNKIAIFASLFTIFATPISFYSITLKHHSLTVFLTLLAFYCFYKYTEKKDNKFIYYAYALAGLCIWTRIVEGVALMVSILLMDMLFFRRSIRHIAVISAIILVSLIPFFTFNQLILGSPFSIIEEHPLTDTPMRMQIEKNMITLNESPFKVQQTELLSKLGYIWNVDIRAGFFDIFSYMMILKLGNTFGILLISPFLIIAFAFIVDRIRSRIKLDNIDKLFGLYFIIYILLYKDHLLSIVRDTPMALEYRYLLVLYIILLYFALRINAVRELIENNLKKIVLLSIIFAIILASILIIIYPPPFMKIYYSLSFFTICMLLVITLIKLFVNKKKYLDRSMTFFMALSLAEAMILLLYYYWVITVTYIAPSDNHTILPVLENGLKWMFQIVF